MGQRPDGSAPCRVRQDAGSGWQIGWSFGNMPPSRKNPPGLPRQQDQSPASNVNLRLGLGDVAERWMIELWGNNVFDRQTRNVTANTPLRAPMRSAPRRVSRSSRREQSSQLCQQSPLPAQQLRFGGIEIEPAGAIDLGKRDPAA